MIRQIRLLLWADLCNICGLNVARFGKDSRRRRRAVLMTAIYALLVIMAMFYVGALTWFYIQIGLAEIVPTYLTTVASLLVLFFTLFRAGGELFDRGRYERLIALPVRPAAIIASRLLRMYLGHAALSLLVLLPGDAVYAWLLRPPAHFYGMLLPGVFLLPLLPITVSTALSVGILAVSARLRRKNAATILLSLLLLAAIFGGSALLATQDEAMLELQLIRLSDSLFSAIARLYPPAALFSRALLHADWGAFALFGAVSVAAFCLFILIVARKYREICQALHTTAAARTYRLQAQTRSPVLFALYRRELRRYFASSIYVLNTIIGPLMMAGSAVAVAVMGADTLEAAVGMPGLFARLAPALLGALGALCPTTGCAISIEGKQWWILQSLPVRTQDVFAAKLLVNLTIALPAYALSELILLTALPFSPMEALWLLLYPLGCLLCSSVIGLRINAAFPRLSWESETVAVKQGAATLLCMLSGLFMAAVPIVLELLLPVPARPLAYPASFAAVCGLSVVVHRQNARMELKTIC